MARAVKLTACEGVAVLDGPDREDVVDNHITLTSTTAETSLLAADAANFIDVFSLVIANSSATQCVVTIRRQTADGAALQELWVVPPGQSVGFHGSPSAARKQRVKNVAWTAQCGTSVASIEISVNAVKRPG